MSEGDDDILQRIQGLVEEERTLRGDGEDGAPGADVARLQRVEEQLDQCWDLLRQRRARREFGENPDEASVRSTETVEHYRQ